jgi:ComEC/Rec2-related protein
MCLLTLVVGLLLVSIDVMWLSGALIVLTGAGIVVVTVRHKRRRGVGIACLLCLSVSLVVMVEVQRVQTELLAKNSDCTVIGRIAAVETDEHGTISVLTLDSLVVNDARQSGKMDVRLSGQQSSPEGYVYADAFGDEYVVGVPLQIGQTVKVTGMLTPITIDYYDSLSMHQLVRKRYYTLFASTCLVETAPRRLTAAEHVRCYVYRTLRTNMCGQAAGFAYAFLTGDACYVTDGILAGYRAAGTAHLLAVSGLHVGLLVGLLLWIFKRCRMPVWAQTGALAVILGLYSWVCFSTPSVMRASVVAVTASLARTVGAHRDRPSMLALAGVVLLCINPLWLYDVSFLLSYAAFAGIVLLYVPMRRLVHKVPNKWGDALALNLAVTLCTLPISIYFFGGVSLLAVPFNLVLIPIMSVVYTLLLVLVIAAAVPALGILLTLLDHLIDAVNLTVVTLGGLGFVGCTLSVWQLPCYYGVVALASPYCLLRDRVRYAAALSILCMLMLWTAVAQFA